VTITIVWPYSSTERRMKPSSSALEVESRLPVGSSAKTIAGLEASALAAATRCCWPPDSSAGLCCRRSRSPTASITVSTHERSGLRPAIASGSSTFSAAVRVGSRLNAWKTKPTLSRRSRVSCFSDRLLSSVSPMKMRPVVIRSSPARQCISVDLPEPDGPMMAV
jgi:hypothetical protein